MGTAAARTGGLGTAATGVGSAAPAADVGATAAASGLYPISSLLTPGPQ
jgi:hypothetical protein